MISEKYEVQYIYSQMIEFLGDREYLHSLLKQWHINKEFLWTVIREARHYINEIGRISYLITNVLSYATPELRGDREIVLAAVKLEGGALRFASTELRGDREIVLAALKKDWGAGKWVIESPELIKDIEELFLKEIGH